MDFNKILEKIKAGFNTFWVWLKPYLLKLREWRRRVWKKYQINKIILLVGLITVLIASVYLFFLAKNADVETLKSGLKEVSTIYDKDEVEAGTLYGQKGTFVEMEQISDNIKNAVLSTEDKRFYEHRGYDIRGIGRAFVGIIRHGRITGGGSTLTQQLAKNAYLSQKQTFDRKARELFLAIEIEKKYTKDEIFQMYLNNAYFGNGVWGVEDASHKYFGKSAAEVNISEGAVLAAMLKGPGIYNPIDYMDNAIARRSTVLDLMVANEKLSEADAEAVKAEGIYLNDNYSRQNIGYQYPYYFDAVLEEAINVHGLKEDDIMNRGYKIYTALDQNYQKEMTETFNNSYLFPPDAEDGTMVQGASVALNPTTGGVEAIIGGRGEHVFRGFNRATQSMISPGSTMKPLSVYTPALEMGYKPNDILKDEALPYYDVQNVDRVYRGEVTMHQALEESLNASAVWLLNEISIEKGAKKAEKFGIKLDKRDHYYGLALGGLTKGTSPLKMASAYSVFANKGVQKKPHFITKIVDATGTVIVDQTDVKGTQITTPEVADQMTSMLRGVFSVGTGANAQPYGYLLAGKTGTTENINLDSTAKDKWIIGYTPDVVVSTWMGFDETSDTHYLPGAGGAGVSTLFKDEMEGILPHSANSDFTVPDASVSDQTKPKIEEEISQKLDEFGGKVKEGAKYWGEKIKEGTGAAKERAQDLWNSLKEGF